MLLAAMEKRYKKINEKRRLEVSARAKQGPMRSDNMISIEYSACKLTLDSGLLYVVMCHEI